MTDIHGQPSKADTRPEFLFKRYFETPAERRPDDGDMREAEAFWSRLAEFSVPKEYDSSQRRPIGQYALLFASVLAVVMGLSLWWNMPGTEPQWRTYASPHASRTVVILEDGSRISLAAESRVDVRFLPTKRDLKLVAGEALFEVAHDRARPFVVQAGGGTIKAVGTAFDIRLAARDTQVTVVKGVVDVGVGRSDAVGKAGSITRATRGDQMRFSFRKQNGAIVANVSTRSNVDPDEVISWTRGKLFFNGDPLWEAITIVNSYSQKQLVLKDPALAEMRVYGILDQGDVRGLVELINNESILSIEGTYTNGH